MIIDEKRRKTMSEVIITQDNFNTEVINSDIPVLVDFWASWCGPCQMLAPAVAQLAENLAGQVKVGKVNVDEQPALAGGFGITSIPTLLLFKGGKVVNQQIGLCSYEDLVRFVK